MPAAILQLPVLNGSHPSPDSPRPCTTCSPNNSAAPCSSDLPFSSSPAPLLFSPPHDPASHATHASHATSNSPSVILLGDRGGGQISPHSVELDIAKGEYPRPGLFNPSPASEAQVIEVLCSPFESLLSVARTFNTTLDDLVAWMARPDIDAKLEAVRSASAKRNRIVATTRLTKVILGCERMIDEYIDEEANDPIRSTDTRAKEQRRRSRETARKASWLIYRISRPEPTPRPPRQSSPHTPSPHAPSSAPRGGGARVREGGGGKFAPGFEHLDHPDAATPAAPAHPAPTPASRPSEVLPEGGGAESSRRRGTEPPFATDSEHPAAAHSLPAEESARVRSAKHHAAPNPAPSEIRNPESEPAPPSPAREAGDRDSPPVQTAPRPNPTATHNPGQPPKGAADDPTAHSNGPPRPAHPLPMRPKAHATRCSGRGPQPDQLSISTLTTRAGAPPPQAP